MLTTELLADWPTLQGIADWLHAGLAGMASPLVIALVLALTTLLVEDLAIAAGAALAAQGLISWELALLAVGGGIAVGDLGLYALGAGARRSAWLRRRLLGDKAQWVRDQALQRLVSLIFVARVVPGLRLATYTSCGFLHVPLLPFISWVVLAVLLWTAGLFALSALGGQALAHYTGLPPAVAVALFIVFIVIAISLINHLRMRSRRSLS